MLETYLISVAIKSTVLLAAGLLCVRFLRGRDAAVRHLVCLVALVSAAAAPLLALWSPQWSFLISVPAGPHGAPGGGNSVATGLLGWPIMLAAIWSLGVLSWRCALWADGLCCCALAASRRILPDGDAAEVRIADVSSPLTCGAWRPLILLPEDARDWDELRLRAVLLHESAHVLRRDCLAKYVAQASRALLWWNPLTWMIAARLNREQELACDDVVLSAGVSADFYATVLLDVARECSSSFVARLRNDRLVSRCANALLIYSNGGKEASRARRQNRHRDSATSSADDKCFFCREDLQDRARDRAAEGLGEKRTAIHRGSESRQTRRHRGANNCSGYRSASA